MGLSHYLGIEVIFSQRVSDLSSLLNALGGYLKDGLSIKETAAS